jgi:hypothetical protein
MTDDEMVIAIHDYARIFGRPELREIADRFSELIEQEKAKQRTAELIQRYK